jgi:hypothetical protein
MKNSMPQKIDFKSLLLDFRFWLLLLFVGHLYGIWFPPLEVAHNWRQTTVTMVARNFLEVDSSIFYPRIDIGGDNIGITGMEFPLLNYLIFLVSKVFGYQHWHGRLIVLIISTIGLFYLYKITKEYFSEKMAFIALILVEFSIWFTYSRKIMPDTFSTALLLISLYYGLAFFKNHELKKLIPYFIFGLFGGLAKLPSIFLFVFLIIPFWQAKEQWLSKKMMLFYFSSAAILLPICWWYFVWCPFLVEKYGYWHFFMGLDYLKGLGFILSEPLESLKMLFLTPLGFSGLILLLVSIVFAVKTKNKQAFYLYLLGLFTFILLVVIKSGYNFYHHSYYMIVFLPVFVLPIAFFLDKINPKYTYIILIIISIEGVASQFHDFKIKENESKLLNLESDLNRFTKFGDEIAINSGEFPTPMYFAHRKGFLESNESLQKLEYRHYLASEGVKAIVVLKKVFGSDTQLPLKKAIDNDDYTIYLLP